MSKDISTLVRDWEAYALGAYQARMEQDDAYDTAIEYELSLLRQQVVGDLLHQLLPGALGERLEGLLLDIAERAIERRASADEALIARWESRQ